MVCSCNNIVEKLLYKAHFICCTFLCIKFDGAGKQLVTMQNNKNTLYREYHKDGPKYKNQNSL